jgi:hypothetical protein
VRRQARLLRADPRPAGDHEVTDLAAVIHKLQARQAPRPEGVPVSTPHRALASLAAVAEHAAARAGRVAQPFRPATRSVTASGLRLPFRPARGPARAHRGP